MEKPDWRRKIKDEHIVQKWRTEAEDFELKSDVFDYALKELDYLAKTGDPEVGHEPTGVDLVWVSPVDSN